MKIVSKTRGRWMRGIEKLAGLGFPVTEEIAAALGVGAPD
jgi:hypothetical protein